MAHQSPMIAIPKKKTDEVDWTTPIRNLIAQSYGESPDNYAAECAGIQRCRQDAVRGAGSDMTARDLLYKYFGQLEQLELRFAEIRVNFPWRDAFTNELITQTSIAYEKASILFQIASTHSAIAAAQSRSDPEGLKRAFYYFRSCAGMLTYINENFLHAPSKDLSRDVIKLLVNVIIGQATEVFFEKCTDEKKGSALVSKVGAQAASIYASLTEEVKEFMGKKILDTNWVTLIQIKSKYFASLSQYHRGLADDATGKHGDALVRFTVAENLAKEASRGAAAFDATFISTLSATLPSDAGSSIRERTKAHLALVSERKKEAQRENDLIYNAVLPAPEALPTIDKLVVATPIPIQEVYGSPDVQKTIGSDIFQRLVPLSVHESASVYSEEKAKLVRAEVENAETAEIQLRSALESLGVRGGLVRFRAIVEGELESGAEVPVDVKRWKEDITLIEEREGVDAVIAKLGHLKRGVQAELDDIRNELDAESRGCEAMRIKYEHHWTQVPSAGPSKTLRQDLKSHYASLEAAAASDQQVLALWESIKGEIHLLLSPQVEDVFLASVQSSSGGQDLLDLDVGSETDEQKERTKIGNYVSEIEERLEKLDHVTRERNEVLKDLKEKIQTDDVSHLLLRNRRNTGVEPALFAQELEKFRPHQQRLGATVHHQDTIIKELTSLWKALKDAGSRGPGARKWDEREKRKAGAVKRFGRARDAYMEVRDGVAKGLQFYTELTELTTGLHRNAQGFLKARKSEQEGIISQIEVERRLTSTNSTPSVPAASPPPPPRPPTEAFASMNLQSPPPPPPSQWQPSQQYHTPPATAPQQYSRPPPPSQNHSIPPHAYQGTYGGMYGGVPQPPHTPPQHQPQQAPPTSLPPPPRAPTYSVTQSDPYASLSMLGLGVSSPPPPPPSNYQPYGAQPGAPAHQYGTPPPPPPGQNPYPGYHPGYGGYQQGYQG